jgi:hypothetical protein
VLSADPGRHLTTARGGHLASLCVLSLNTLRGRRAPRLARFLPSHTAPVVYSWEDRYTFLCQRPSPGRCSGLSISEIQRANRVQPSRQRCGLRAVSAQGSTSRRRHVWFEWRTRRFSGSGANRARGCPALEVTGHPRLFGTGSMESRSPGVAIAKRLPRHKAPATPDSGAHPVGSV